MGKKRIAIIGEESSSVKTTEGKEKHRKSLKEEKGVHIPGLKGGERVVAVAAEPLPEEQAPQEQKSEKKKKASKARGKKYLAKKIKIDPKKGYPLAEAITLLKETSYSRFDGAAEIHLVVAKKGISAEVSLPYFKGKEKRVEIASEETIKKIEAGKIDFDVLLSTPAFMPKLLKYAKILGPKGLMPNPKNGTITEKPEEAIKTYQKASLSIKTESSFPLIHAVFGKISQPEKELEENLKALLSAVGARNIRKAVIKATMGPGIRINYENFNS